MNFIHQELAFVPGMNVIQNIMLGLPKATRFGMVDWRTVAREVAPVAARVGITAPLFASVKGLSTAEKWLINICRALVRKARLIVMDEPTASLSAAEGEKLFRIVEDLSRSGVAVLYVSHRLDEILRLCHRVTAFRDGRSVAAIGRSELTRPALVEAIVGRAVERVAKPADPPPASAVALSVRGLARHPRVNGVDFDLRRGEVLGIGGLVGAGRTELVRLIYGADRTDAGTMLLDGQPFAPCSPAEAVRKGLGLVPEERRARRAAADEERRLQSPAREPEPDRPRTGPAAHRRPAAALAVATNRARPGREDARHRDARRPPQRRQSAEGGDRPLAAARPQGADPRRADARRSTFGARGEIHRLIRDLAARGMAVIAISSEPRRVARPVRPRPRHGRGPHCARTRRRGPDPQRHHRGELRRTDRSFRMSAVAAPSRRLSPRTKTALGFFARYATIIGLVGMIAAFAILSPRAFPTVNNFTNSAEPGLARHDHRGRADARGRGGRTRPVDRLRGGACTASWSRG